MKGCIATTSLSRKKQGGGHGSELGTHYHKEKKEHEPSLFLEDRSGTSPDKSTTRYLSS